MPGEQEISSHHHPKWFVYFGDHHEGPFSAETLAEWFEKGQISEATYLWCEGQADWSQLQEIPKLLESLRVENPAEAKEVDDLSDFFLEKEVNPKKNRLPLLLSLLLISSTLYVGEWFEFGWTDLRWQLAMRVGALMPELKPHLAPFPVIEGMEISDQSRLLEATVQPPVKDHPSVTAATVQEDLLKPELYIASNLPHGKRLEIVLHGEKAQLLGAKEHTERYATYTHRDRVTAPIILRQKNGLPLPKGQYELTITGARGQDIYYRESIFIGGRRDDQFERRLSAFNDQIHSDMQNERMEIREYYSTLKSQLEATEEQFLQTASIEKRGEWQEFSALWTALHADLARALNERIPENISDASFHQKDAYYALKEAHRTLQSLHEAQHESILNARFGDLATQKLNTPRLALQKTLSAIQDAIEIPSKPQETLFD